MATPLRIGVIVSSIREGRLADVITPWVSGEGGLRSDMSLDILDLRDFALPQFDEPVSPAYAPPTSDAARRWAAALARFDGFIIVAAEYNHAPTSALKNALDYAYSEFNRKPVAFVGYGGLGAARAIEQLRLICVELQMAPTRTAVHIAGSEFVSILQRRATPYDYPFLGEGLARTLDDLAWWGEALRSAREQTS